MAVNLTKGQKVDLTKGNTGLNNIVVGLGWDVNKYDGDNEFDLDASAYILGANGKVRSDEDMIFFNNTNGANGAVVHTGDNLTGEGEGDDEQIKIDLSKVPDDVEKVSFAITIHEATERNQNFGQVSNAFVRIVDESKNEELIRYDLGEDFSIETAIIVGELYKHNSEWKFAAIGAGYQGGLAAVCTDFGVTV
ncbi:MAG: TerD family protein [Bacteroidales bacterium]|nr:TerD family protein [Bacteroidales bacterium]